MHRKIAGHIFRHGWVWSCLVQLLKSLTQFRAVLEHVFCVIFLSIGFPFLRNPPQPLHRMSLPVAAPISPSWSNGSHPQRTTRMASSRVTSSGQQAPCQVSSSTFFNWIPWAFWNHNLVRNGETRGCPTWQEYPYCFYHTLYIVPLSRFCLAGLPVGYQFRNITNADVNNLLLEDLIIWTNYEIEVAAYNSAGLGVYSSKVTEWTLQGGKFSTGRKGRVDIFTWDT